MIEPSIILVRPQMGENIGATARVMQNFGMKDLRIVCPRDGWPNIKADEMSAKALDIVRNAKIYTTVPRAVEDLNFVYASTARSRELPKPSISSRFLAKDQSSSSLNVKIGILFGRESIGLTNEEMSLANKIVVVPTSKENTSMNLAQAVAVICYELSSCLKYRDPLEEESIQEEDLATKLDIEYFLNRLNTALKQKKFFRVENKENVLELKIANIFNKITKISKQEIQILHGIISALL